MVASGGTGIINRAPSLRLKGNGPSSGAHVSLTKDALAYVIGRIVAN